MSQDGDKRLLLVEDEAILLLSEKRALEEYGYIVHAVNSGEAAIAFVKATPGLDLVLMDINLGKGIDGTEAAEIILRDRDIPIVFLSSHSEREIVRKTEKITSYGYVVKSSSITVLDASIKMAFKLFDAKISERKLVGALSESEIKYRSLIENSSDAIFCVDEKGAYKFTNQLFASTFGKTPEYFEGKSFWDIYSKEQADYRFETTSRVFQTGESESIEVEVPLPDKTLVFYATANPIRDNTGKIVLALTRGVNITDRKRIETALKDSEARSKALFDKSIVGIVLVGMDKKFIDCNEAFCKFTGFSREEILAKSIADITYPDDIDIGDRELGKLAHGEIESTVFEKRYIRKSGSIAWGELNISIIRNAMKGASYFMAVIVDITGRKRAEEDIKALLAEKETILREVRDHVKDASIR